MLVHACAHACPSHSPTHLLVKQCHCAGIACSAAHIACTCLRTRLPPTLPTHLLVKQRLYAGRGACKELHKAIPMQLPVILDVSLRGPYGGEVAAECVTNAFAKVVTAEGSAWSATPRCSQHSERASLAKGSSRQKEASSCEGGSRQEASFAEGSSFSHHLLSWAHTLIVCPIAACERVCKLRVDRQPGR